MSSTLSKLVIFNVGQIFLDLYCTLWWHSFSWSYFSLKYISEKFQLYQTSNREIYRKPVYFPKVKNHKQIGLPNAKYTENVYISENSLLYPFVMVLPEETSRASVPCSVLFP